MKKVLAICLTLLFVASIGATVCAAPAGFVSSPSGHAAPVLVSAKALSDGCTAQVKITPYGEKNTLSADAQAQLEKAYADITANLNGLVSGLKGEDLAVSYLFDISATGCANHADHEGFTITLAVDGLNRFEGLLHLNANGKWEKIDAKIVNSGKNLQFTVKDLSPFAVVIDTKGGNSPATGDNMMAALCAVMVAMSALAVAIVCVKGKKNA